MECCADPLATDALSVGCIGNLIKTTQNAFAVRLDFRFFLCHFLKQKWRFQRRSKGPPKLQIGSEGTPKGFRGSEVAPKRTRRAARVLLEGSDGAPKGFWNGPKGSKGALESFRRSPKGSRRGPEGPPQGSRRASGFGREIGGPRFGGPKWLPLGKYRCFRRPPGAPGTPKSPSAKGNFSIDIYIYIY